MHGELNIAASFGSVLSTIARLVLSLLDTILGYSLVWLN